jgi:hypothetical protein
MCQSIVPIWQAKGNSLETIYLLDTPLLLSVRASSGQVEE